MLFEQRKMEVRVKSDKLHKTKYQHASAISITLYIVAIYISVRRLACTERNNNFTSKAVTLLGVSYNVRKH